MGIIKNIKVNYRSKLMSNLLREYRKNKKVNTDFINLYDALCTGLEIMIVSRSIAKSVKDREEPIS